jgi:MATE family multidrug resistance protein
MIMSQEVPLNNEPRWEGMREVVRISWPIILGTLSYTIMQFADAVMVARVSKESLAAIGPAIVWTWTLGTFIFGITTASTTFVAQSMGRGRKADCGRYGWQTVYLSLLALVAGVVIYPFAGYLFGIMNHGPEVTALEVAYFRIRLAGYMPMAWVMGMAGFFQALNRSKIPMWTAVYANTINIALNYVLIFGHFGFPAMGIAGAAWATVIAQWLQVGMLMMPFLSRKFDEEFATRVTWRFDPKRCLEMLRIGMPSGMSMFLDVANWGIFISFIVGYFGEVALAANNAAVNFMHLSFMPALAISQGVSALVGQYIGKGDIARAKARTYTALRLAVSYMVLMGVFYLFFGATLTRIFFSDNPEVIDLARRLLILAAIFQAFDGICIISMGALRGAGDTRWMMWATFIVAYLVFLPAATFTAIVLNTGAYGAWLGATVYILVLSGTLFGRFRSEKWRNINIFTESMEQVAATRAEVQTGQVVTAEPQPEAPGA